MYANQDYRMLQYTVPYSSAGGQHPPPDAAVCGLFPIEMHTQATPHTCGHLWAI